MKVYYKQYIPPAVEFSSLTQGEIGTLVTSNRAFVKITMLGFPNACFLDGGIGHIEPEEKVIPAKAITIEE